MSIRMLVVTCLWLLMAVPLVQAQQAGVFAVQGTNLAPGENAAIGHVLAAAYAYRTQRPVLGPDELAQALAETGSERDAAQRLGLTEYLHVDAVRLMSRISLLITLRNKWGTDLYRMHTTARSLDDMEVVSERVAAAVARRTDIEYTRGLDNVMAKETYGRNRTFVEKIFGVRMAGFLPIANHLEPGLGMSMMFDARFETQDFFAEFGGGLMLRPDTHETDASLAALVAHLGASYYLAHTSASPYLGLGMSPRLNFGDYRGAAFAVNAQFGVMFMRESSTRIYLEFRVDQNLAALQSDSSYAYSNSASADYPAESSYEATRRRAVLPTELSLAAGIGW